MKTLVIVTHPDIKNSIINKRWVEELKKYPDEFTVHDIHALYPDGKINVQAEQALVEQHAQLVFQFPVYWFSSPGFLKTWFDDVLLHGWAYGSKSGYKLGGKKVALAMTAGVDEKEYRPNERYKYTLEQLTRPFEITFAYVKADYRPFFAYYGIEYNSSAAWVEQSVPQYLSFLRKL